MAKEKRDDGYHEFGMSGLGKITIVRPLDPPTQNNGSQRQSASSREAPAEKPNSSSK